MLQRFRLDGRVAIVTGAGRGLGREMALALARAGADLVVAARTAAQIDATAGEIRAIGRRCISVPADVRAPEQVQALVARCLDAFGQLDILLCNAGGGGMAAGTAIEDCPDDAWRDTVDLNLSSAFYCLRSAVPVMKRQGAGAIITVASGTGVRGDGRNWAYSAAKAGLMAFTRSMALQLAPSHIRVNCIVPGFISREVSVNPEVLQHEQMRGRFVPVRRSGRAEELGPLAVYLASNASSYVTGETFAIDGGGLAAGVAPTGWAPEVPLGGA